MQTPCKVFSLRTKSSFLYKERVDHHFPYMRNLYQEMDWKTFCDTKKEINIWIKVQWNIASLDAAMEFCGM